ncbi:uncharacterized protein LOC143362804 [Halictus rubicundus]|uniref:uncharacterized protein LOC143362804 n=1 Tax=Halictus rubicundus TaxID=77578 RepID=UPI004036FA05
MEDLCPLCFKNGKKRKVKLLQINLQEAVWMCEEDKCPWPFGYKRFIFCPRIVGKIWSCYWDDHKSTAKLKESVVSSVKQLPLCDSPSTVIKTESADICSNTLNLSTNHSENNGFSKTKIENDDYDLQTVLHNKSEIFCDSNEDRYKNDAEGTNNSHIIKSSLQSVNNETGTKKVNNECVNASNKIFEEGKDCGMENSENIEIIKGIPKIRNIKKTNINVSTVNGNKNLEEELLHINKSTSVTGKKYLSNDSLESSNFVNSELSTDYLCDNEVTEIKSNINTTKVKIDGLPPIKLSSEIPECTTVSKTVIPNPEQSIDGSTVSSDIKLSTPMIRNTLVKRKVTSGKQYEKFSFGNIKKKLDTNSSIDSNSSNERIINDIGGNGNSDEISHSNKTIVNCNSNSEKLSTSIDDTYNITTNNENQMNSIKANNIPSYKNMFENTRTEVNSITVDTLLKECLSNNYSNQKDITDAWIDALLC